jgi:hypothetical protein
MENMGIDRGDAAGYLLVSANYRMTATPPFPFWIGKKWKRRRDRRRWKRASMSGGGYIKSPMPT